MTHAGILTVLSCECHHNCCDISHAMAGRQYLTALLPTIPFFILSAYSSVMFLTSIWLNSHGHWFSVMNSLCTSFYPLQKSCPDPGWEQHKPMYPNKNIKNMSLTLPTLSAIISVENPLSIPYVLSWHRLLTRFTAADMHPSHGSVFTSNHKVVGCLHNHHTTIVPLDITCSAGWYCRM